MNAPFEQQLFEAIQRSFLTCRSGDGDPYVKIQFSDLKQAQDFFKLLHSLRYPAALTSEGKP